MANIWTVQNNISLGTYNESVSLSGASAIQMAVPVGSTLKLISGNIPPGLRIDGTTLRGTPLEVARETEFKFVIRATLNDEIEDRTFKITIVGADEPIWVTPEGDLALGNNNAVYVLDSSPINYQLQATDKDLGAGQKLEYFIASGDGQLPPGITLSSTGLISGVVDPVLALDKLAAQGYYDDNAYGTYAFDFGTRPANGYDSYFYDVDTYDLSVPTKSPKKLNRNYQFRVSVSDGDTVSKRQFRIYVVGDDFLRSDNTILQIGDGVFSADNTHVRTPIWLTPSELGYRRANNYVTLFLDIVDKETLSGFVGFTLENVNDDGSPSIIPPGLELDSATGELAGVVPYQPAVTKEYKFTINAVRYAATGTTTFENVDILIYDNASKGDTVIKISKNDRLLDLLNQTITIKGQTYLITQVNNAILAFDTITINRPLETYTRAGLVFTEELTDSTTSILEANKKKTFTVTLLGEVDSTITWLSDSKLGIIGANYTSVFAVKAKTSVPNAVIRYTLTSGRLPPGLTLALDGEIFGKVRQFGENYYRAFWKSGRVYNAGDVVKYDGNLYLGNSTHTASGSFSTDLTTKWEPYKFVKSGLATFDSGELVFDGDSTTVDKSYTFTVNAQDQFGFSAITKSFTINVDDPNDFVYSNLIVQPMMKESQKALFNNFISDPTIFTPSDIYRPSDIQFGIQNQVKMLVYAGIETKFIQDYVAAASKNHKRKKFKFGSINSAIAKVPGTNDSVYEVVYVNIIDPADTNRGVVKESIKIKTRSALSINQANYETKDNSSGVIDDNSYRLRAKTNPLDISSDAVKISENLDNKRYISNITNMRNQLAKVGVSDGSFLPLWMRTPQENSIEELGYVTAVPLCYCKPGQSADIIINIKNSGFNFTTLEFEVDRYVIDSTKGNSEEQYILFANYEFNV
jgi:hypothetical protein